MKFLRFLLILLLAAGLIFSLWQLGSYYMERRQSSEATDTLYTQAVATPIPDAASATEPENAEPQTTEEPEDVWAEYAPFSMDFSVLWEQSKDVVAWLYCENTVINYPIAQYRDNEYYEERLLDGSWNAGGTLFLECRNQKDFTDFQSFVYGHNMVNGSMFGTLDEYYHQSYYDEHPVMYLLTPEQYYKVELVAGVVTPIDSWLYEMDYSDPMRKADLVYTWRQLSTFEPAVDYSEEDRFLVLSTCTYDYDNARYLLIGKLTPVGGALHLEPEREME